MSDRVGIRDTGFSAPWHREDRREAYRDLDRIFTACGSRIDEDVLGRRSEPTCPVCWAKR